MKFQQSSVTDLRLFLYFCRPRSHRRKGTAFQEAQHGSLVWLSTKSGQHGRQLLCGYKPQGEECSRGAFLAEVFILQTGAGVPLCPRMASLFLLLKPNCAAADLGDPPTAVAARPGGALAPRR